MVLQGINLDDVAHITFLFMLNLDMAIGPPGSSRRFLKAMPCGDWEAALDGCGGLGLVVGLLGSLEALRGQGGVS
jgi:hypothetical protein